MGTVYAIECTLKVNRKKAPGDTLRETLAKAILEQTDKPSYEELETLRGCIDFLFVASQHTLSYNEESQGNEYIIYINSVFDTNDDWQNVMVRCFKAIAPLLENGSTLYVEPDNDHYRYTVKNGKAILEVNLPESMDIPMPDLPIDESEMEDYINDQLSNRSGWCVNTYNYTIKGNTIHVTNIDWDTSD